ncbi:MAG: hypothetical protein Q8O72_11840 [Bacteroidales bacterium]|nr:hypothetical protein [Bacteroidales bacterium]
MAVILNSNDCHSQTCHTLSIQPPAYLLLRDTSIHVLHDTTITVCEQYILLTESNGYTFYDKLLSASDKHLFLKDVYRMVLSGPPPDTALQKMKLIQAQDVYKPYAGKPISKIRIQVLKPFGPVVADTNRPIVTDLERGLNSTHFNTREWIIRDKLLFSENDKVDPMIMVENTRMLTNLSYLQDASITVMPSQGDSVEVLVLVKDKFPWLIIPRINSPSYIQLYAKQANIVGLGQGLGLETTYQTSSQPKIYMSQINYTVDNVYKLISGDFNYQVANNNQLIQLRFDRQLIPAKVHWGGGIEISQTAQNIITDPTHQDKSLYYFKYMYYDVWMSHLFTLNKFVSAKNAGKVFVIPGIRFNKTNYSEHPLVNIDTNSQFYNYDFILGNLVLARQDYYRTNYLTNFGKAEYLPFGFNTSITAGYSWTEFMNKPYLGLGFALTTHINDFGFLLGRLDVGSHFVGNLQQGALKANLLFLSDLHETANNKYRFKSEFGFTTGINRFTNDLLYLGDQYGIIGLSKETFYGQQRIFAEASIIDYTSMYFAGFRVALIGFVSAGTLGPEDIKIFNRQLISSFGGGVYIQNDFLAFSSLEFKMAYFPYTPQGVSHFGFTFSSENLLNRINFLFTKPQQVVYQ